MERLDDNDEATISQQAAACEEFARPTKKRQQQRITAWTTKQKAGNLTPAVNSENHYFSVERNVLSRIHCLLVFHVFVCFLLLVFVGSCLQFFDAGTKGNGSDWDVNQMRELLYQGRSAHHRLDLR